MSKSTKTITASLLDALALFIGVYGIIFSIITAYDIKLQGDTVVKILLVSAIFFSVIFNIDKYKKTVYISTAAVCALLFLINFEPIADGFLKFLNFITSKLHEFSPSVAVTKDVHISFTGSIRAYTAFFSFFAAILVLLLALSIIKAHSAWLSSVISISTFFISLIFVKSIPDMGPVIAFIVFFLSTIMTGFIRKSGSKRASFMLAVFMPVILIFTLIVNSLFPEGTYSRAGLADIMYGYFSERLPLNLKDNQSVGSVTYVESFGSEGSLVSGTGSGVDTRKKVYQAIDLNKASPDKSGVTVLKVNSDKEGNILLRGFSLGSYTGSSWVQFDANTQNILKKFSAVAPFDKLSSETYATPLSFPTYAALTSDNAQRNFISINEEESGGEIVYTPYYPLFNNFQNMVYGDDSVILYKNNANFHRNEKAAYGIYAYSLGDITKALNKTSDSRNNDQYKKIERLEQEYKQSVYTYYTQINGDTRSLLKEFTKGQNFDQISDRKALTDAVCQFVKKSASYNINTQPTPEGKDYLRYFLTESKQGYCMHFATEATLIFRMLGVPARYVSGFSVNISGDQVGKWTSATDRNSHAWTEVYFDGIGWVPVDVTPVDNRTGVNSSSSSTSSTSSTPVTSGNTSSNPASGSSASSSSTATVSGSSDTSTTMISPKTHINLPIWIYPAAVLLIAVIFIFARRKYLINKRRKAFVQESTNKAVIFAWNYIVKLKAYRVDPDKSIYSTAQKAVFSKHTLSEDERKKVVGFAEEKSKELDSNLGFFKRLVFRYIKGLY